MDKEKIISYDFQGWPIEKMTLREILDRLGVHDYKIDDEKALDCCPIVLIDDGMGYGVNENYIVEASIDNGEVIFFREPELPGIDLFKELDVCPGQVIKLHGKEFEIYRVNEEGNFQLFEKDDDKLMNNEGETITLAPEKLKELLNR
jgi:hypothetical protein